jgi:uncharacterized protein (DUF4415 family)
MKRGNPNPLTEAQKAELAKLAAQPDSTTDTSDMPPMTEFAGGIRGAFFRPVKKPVYLRLDADILAWFQRAGDGYQTRINKALREYVEKHEAEHT